VSSLPDGFVEWNTGTRITGQSLQRFVLKSTSAQITVNAACGESNQTLDVW